MTDDEKINDFCEALKEFWNNCPDELRADVKAIALKPKFPKEDYLKSGLYSVWAFYHLEAKEKRALRIVDNND